MSKPTPAVLRALCDVLSSFSGSPSELAQDDAWQHYLLSTTALLSRVSGHLQLQYNNDGSSSTSTSSSSQHDVDMLQYATDLPDRTAVIDHCTATLDSVVSDFTAADDAVNAQRTEARATVAREWASLSRRRQLR